MLTEERHRRILSYLTSTEIVTINDLMTPLNASESTIRRDLQTLENQGLLVRIHGGAKRIHQLTFEAEMSEKIKTYLNEKQTIAKYAASLIRPDDIIYLDAGTTTLAMIPFLPTDYRLKVVTNSVKHASLLIDRQIPTVILGGQIKLTTNAVLGTSPANQLERYRFNQSFIGINGIHLVAGYTTPDTEEGLLKRIGFKNSQHSYILADHSKFQQITFTQVGTLAEACIITDYCPADLKKKFLQKTTLKEANK